MIGSTIEHYKITDVLGEGGMGIVYKAFDLKLERYVAIKILNTQATTNPQFVERFRREARHQAKLNHGNIVPVYGLTESRQILGIVMEYVDGETLEHMIRIRGRLELKESLIILKQILTGADYAHKKGFIHRDIKPSNIIVNSEGIAKIMDFGISKSLTEMHGITKTGTKIGTILYMSPEQIKAHEPTAQSDIYSIGITFYEMLAGKTPFDAPTEFEIMEGHLKKNPLKLSATYSELPIEVDRIIAKAMNKSLAKRYTKCDDFLFDVDILLASLENLAKKIKKKDITKVTENDRPPRGYRIRFYFLAFSFIFVFIVLSFYFYGAISESWKKASTKNMNVRVERQEIAATGTKFKPVLLNTSASLWSIYFIDDSIGVSCGNNGTILRTTDCGKNWVSISDSSLGNLYSVTFIYKTKGIITGENGIVLTSFDKGETWKKTPPLTTNSLFSVHFLDNSTGFIVGGNGTIFKSIDSGTSWQIINSPTGNILYSVFFLTRFEGFITGWNGEILKTIDGGNSWKEENKFSNSYFRSVFFINAKDGFIVGAGGEIYKTSDTGRKWKLIQSNTFSGLYKIHFVNEKEGFILGTRGDILYTSDAGVNWKSIQTNSYYSLTDLAVTPEGKIFIAGYNGTILSN
jgi:serine/threonine-protein kinase